ncbi:hypothetical protein JCM10550A_05550 [Methanogenium cariaci]
MAEEMEPGSDTGDGGDDGKHAEGICIIYCMYLVFLTLADRDGLIAFSRWINVILITIVPVGFYIIMKRLSPVLSPYM